MIVKTSGAVAFPLGGGLETRKPRTKPWEELQHLEVGQRSKPPDRRKIRTVWCREAKKVNSVVRVEDGFFGF